MVLPRRAKERRCREAWRACLDDRARRPVLVAAITDDEGALQGVQVTLLSAHGTAKAALATPRRVIGRLLGGEVRIAEAHTELVIGEGVETMLSAFVVFGAPAWAALTADNLGRIAIAPPLDRLIIASDNDDAGARAATSLRARMSAATSVEIEPAPSGFNDWNDWARRKVRASWSDRGRVMSSKSSSHRAFRKPRPRRRQ